MCPLYVYRVYLLCLSQSSGPANKKGTQPKLRPHTVFLVSIKFSNEIHGVCFYPALPCFLRHDIFLLVCRFCFQTNGKPFFSSSSRSVFCCRGQVSASVNLLFCLMGTFFPDVACVVSRLFGLSFDGIVLHFLYALVVGIAHLAQFNKGLKIV